MEWAMVHRPFFASVISPRPDEATAIALDLSKESPYFADVDLRNPVSFESLIKNRLHRTAAKMALGGYLEHRNLYQDASIFKEMDSDEERDIHLGVDIWMPEGTEIFAPLDGRIHSFSDNKGYGNYGPTIILKHNPAPELEFYTLYGHLTREDLNGLSEGQKIEKAGCFAHFGNVEENGNWAPHLHFQIILNIGDWKGDYPGVASKTMLLYEKLNCPDPNIIINCPLI